jgi:hypothetical protein
MNMSFAFDVIFSFILSVNLFLVVQIVHCFFCKYSRNSEYVKVSCCFA